MYKKVCCTCKVAFLLIRPTVNVTYEEQIEVLSTEAEGRSG